MNIEASAPFKLTADMASIMRCGSNSFGYQMFIENVKAYYDAARRPAALSSLCNCIRVTQLSSSNPLGCIEGGERFVKSFRERFNEGMDDLESRRFIEVSACLQSICVAILVFLWSFSRLCSALFCALCFLNFVRQQDLIARAEENLSMRMCVSCKRQAPLVLCVLFFILLHYASLLSYC